MVSRAARTTFARWLVAAHVVAVSGCLLDRSPLPLARDDAAGLDAALPPAEEDAAGGLDAPSPVDTGLILSTRDAGSASPDSASCGRVGEACCTGSGELPCVGVTACEAGRCVACGGENAPCCARGTCGATTLACDSTSHCRACGGPGARCCDGASCNAATLACSGDGNCHPLDTATTPCTSTLACHADQICERGECVDCGDSDEPCCPPSGLILLPYCYFPSVCVFGTCS